MFELIIHTLAAVAAAEAKGDKPAVTQATRDAYDRLKRKLLNRFAANADVTRAIEAVEQKPESKARRDVLAEEMRAVLKESDAELASGASALGPPPAGTESPSKRLPAPSIRLGRSGCRLQSDGWQ